MLYPWIPAYELARCYDQLNFGGNASPEHAARVIQSRVDALSDSASVDWSNRNFFVTSHRVGDCIADSMRRQVAREDEEEPELNPGKRRTCFPPGPVDSCGSIQAQRQGQKDWRKGRCIRCSLCAPSADIKTKFLPGGPVSVGRIVSCTWPSRHPLVQLLRAGRCDFVNVRDPIPYVRL